MAIYLLGFNNITRCPTKMVSMNQIPKMSPNAISCHKLGPILTTSGHLGSYSGKPWTSNSLRPVSGFVDLGWHKIYLETLRLLRLVSKAIFSSCLKLNRQSQSKIYQGSLIQKIDFKLPLLYLGPPQPTALRESKTCGALPSFPFQRPFAFLRHCVVAR